MPRTARLESKSGIYHVMLRGINRQQIFHDDEDNAKFLDTIKICKEISLFELYCYCLMSNHVHILLKPQNESLANIFKRIGSRYVYWYNLKYGRLGHLFQDRYKSETIENERHMLAVLRYIHNNPVKAGLAANVKGYRWSSYNEYINGSGIIDSSLALGILGFDGFIEFHKTTDDESYLDDAKTIIRLNDEGIKSIMGAISGCNNAEAFQKLDKAAQRAYLKHLRESGGSIRQISRLTGISKGIVEKAF